MKAIIEAVRDLINDAGVATYFVDVPERPTYPYVLVWSSPGRVVTTSLSDDDDYLDDVIGLTYVAEISESVLDLAGLVRPLVRRTRFSLGGGVVGWLRHHDSQTVQVDRSVNIPGVGHPAFAVDLLRVVTA